MADITLEKINKINGQVLTQDDIQKIDDNMSAIETTIKSIGTGGGNTLTYSEFVI